MYIGRDEDYGCDYEGYRKYLDEQGWDVQEIETSQIANKVPLGK